MCTDSDCEGDTNEQCTEGVLAGCDCFNLPTVIADSYDMNWLAEQQVLLGMLSANDPGWEYTTLSWYDTGTATASQQLTTTSPVSNTTSTVSNTTSTVPSTTSTVPSTTSTIPSTTSWYVPIVAFSSHFTFLSESTREFGEL